MDDATLTLRLLEYLDRVPGWEWRPEGPDYTRDEVGLFYGQIGAAPDEAIGVRVYGAGSEGDVDERRVQFRIRGRAGDRERADQIAGTLRTLLEGLSRWGGILSAMRFSFAPTGADENGREERTDNYLITLDNLEVSHEQ